MAEDADVDIRPITSSDFVPAKVFRSRSMNTRTACEHGGIRYGALRRQRSHSNAYAVLSPLAATLLMAQTQSIIGRIRLGDFRGALLGHAHMRRSKLCSTKICESNRKCNVLIKDDGSDGVWEAQTIDFNLDEDDDGDYGTIC